MKGSLLITILLVIAGTMGIGLWYTIEKAYYINVTDISEINVGGTIRNCRCRIVIDDPTAGTYISGSSACTHNTLCTKFYFLK